MNNIVEHGLDSNHHAHQGALGVKVSHALVEKGIHDGHAAALILD